MVLINVYAGREVRNGYFGVEYSIPASFTFPCAPNITFDEVKHEIFMGLKVNPHYYTLNIQTRCNVAPPGSIFFNLVPIDSERVWGSILYNALPGNLLELFIESIPNSGSLPVSSDMNQWSYEPNTGGLPGSSLPGRTSSPVSEDEDDGDQTDEDDRDETDRDEEDDEDEEGEEDRDEDDETDEDDNSDYAHVWTQVRPTIPFVGRSDKHPVRSFNDVSGFTPADERFFATNDQFESPLSQGQTFPSKEHLQCEIRDYHIKQNIQVTTSNSSRSKLVVKCENEMCTWKLYATPTGAGTNWIIKTCKYPHTCYATPTRLDHKQLTASMIADVIREDIRENLELKIKDIRGLVRKVFPGVEPKYNKLWRAREMALAQLFGSWEGSYALLPRLLNAIQATNPGSKIDLQTFPTSAYGVRQFHRAAWAFGPCIEAFPNLRPVIAVDAAFLSGRYKGRLLTACGFDAENQLLPLAFALVEQEDNSNWGWFMTWLRREVIGPNKKVCVISDRHISIKHVFESTDYGWCEDMGEGVHRLCAQHISENVFKMSGRDKNLIQVFKWAIKKKKPWRFQEAMDGIERSHPEVFEYLKKIGKRFPEDVNEPEARHKWTQCDDGGYRWGIMTSNGSESLNAVFRISRQLPVAAIVEDTYYKCLAWFVDRKIHAQDLTSAGQIWSTKITKTLQHRGNKSRKHKVKIVSLSRGEYEVGVDNERITRTRRGKGKYVISLRHGELPTCTCQKPNLTGIPCAHVLAVCGKRNLQVNEYVHPYYSTATLVQTWSGEFYSYGDERNWPEYHGPEIVPDPTKVQRGRRKHKRIPMTMDEMEGRRRPKTCRNCRQVGHSAKRCNMPQTRAGN